MPRIMPDPRYISMPSVVVGAEVRMNRDLNWRPWVRSLTHSPDAVTHSPAEMLAACPTVVTSSRCPRALIRRTQKPFSALWNVTRSTRPARTSWVEDSGCGFSRLFTRFQAPLLLTSPGSSRTAKRVLRLLPGFRGAGRPLLAPGLHRPQDRCPAARGQFERGGSEVPPAQTLVEPVLQTEAAHSRIQDGGERRRRNLATSQKQDNRRPRPLRSAA